jgi:hypothetical protein
MTEPLPPIEQKTPTEQKQQLAEDALGRAVHDEKVSSTILSLATAQIHLPRITIKYCTQCRWMLRAAYVWPPPPPPPPPPPYSGGGGCICL